MCRGGNHVETGRIFLIVGSKGNFLGAHGDVQAVLVTQSVLDAVGNDLAGTAQVEDTDFTALQDVLGTKVVPDIQTLIQRNNFVHGHAAKGDHTIYMRVDRNHFIRLVQTGDQKLIPSLLGAVTLKIALIAGITNIDKNNLSFQNFNFFLSYAILKE
jgi:hypothetical protein